MNERIKEIMFQSGLGYMSSAHPILVEKFAELIVAKVLDEVADRAYVSGDRAWSDDLDRHWVELEFGFGRLAELNYEKN